MQMMPCVEVYNTTRMTLYTDACLTSRRTKAHAEVALLLLCQMMSTQALATVLLRQCISQDFVHSLTFVMTL